MVSLRGLLLATSLVACGGQHVVVSEAPAPPSAGFLLAVTYDDLPFQEALAPADGALGGTSRLLATLTARSIPAVGFVNCDRGGDELLRLWRAAGLELGNHQANHDNLNRVPLETWLDGARRCHEALKVYNPPRFFRYPYLFQGKTVEVRDAAYATLRGELGQTVAHVTIDNHEWRLAQLYSEALAAGDLARAEAVRGEYIPHLLAATANARAVAQEKLGREVAQVLLLHMNALSVELAGPLMDALAAEGARFVPLEQALADPVFSLPDAYVGPAGISWLYRIEPVVSAWTWEDETWTDLEARYNPPPPPSPPPPP
ncbi:polysaccharide deacetylase family protein [Myxococcota bacterium]|nr:polysaccharide deacetylase family protein [Myxococcota bacterium]